MIKSNSIKTVYVDKIKKSFTRQKYWHLLIIVCGILFGLSNDNNYIQIHIDYIRNHPGEVLHKLSISFLFLIAILGPLTVLRLKINQRLIKSFEYLPNNAINIITYNNSVYTFELDDLPVYKEKRDWYLGYFGSSRMGVFNDLSVAETERFIIIIKEKKFYIIPFLFESDDFPWNNL